jgi:hypothetical protein
MLSQLHILRLRFDLTLLSTATFPAYKGDMLRRALLWHLGTMWCRQPQRCRHGCQAPDVCLFGRLMDPPPDPTWTKRLRRMMGPTPPPAYVLWDRHDRRRDLASGDTLSVEMTLIGDLAIRQQPAFIAAMLVAGEKGIGRARTRAKLERVVALTGPTDAPHPLLVNDVWQGAPLDDVVLSYADGQAWRDALGYAAHPQPVTHLQVRYLSPVKIKKRGKVMHQPDFTALARAAVRRLRILSQVFGAGEWVHDEWGPLLDIADQVRLAHHETTWVHAKRHSRHGPMPLDGFVGQAWYDSEEDLRPLLPALWLAQWVHVGKGAVWGNGRYRIKGEDK